MTNTTGLDHIWILFGKNWWMPQIFTCASHLRGNQVVLAWGPTCMAETRILEGMKVKTQRFNWVKYLWCFQFRPDCHLSYHFYSFTQFSILTPWKFPTVERTSVVCVFLLTLEHAHRCRYYTLLHFLSALSFSQLVQVFANRATQPWQRAN